MSQIKHLHPDDSWRSLQFLKLTKPLSYHILLK